MCLPIALRNRNNNNNNDKIEKFAITYEYLIWKSACLSYLNIKFMTILIYYIYRKKAVNLWKNYMIDYYYFKIRFCERYFVQEQIFVCYGILYIVNFVWESSIKFLHSNLSTICNFIDHLSIILRFLIITNEKLIKKPL